MKKRPIAVFVCVILVIALLPAVTLAEDCTDIWVGNTQIKEDTYYINDSVTGGIKEGGDENSYNVFYKNDVLILKDTNITECRDMGGDLAAICASQSLTVKLVGGSCVSGANTTDENINCIGIYIRGTDSALTIQGTGSLTVTGGEVTSGDSKGVYCENTVTIESGTVTAIGGTASKDSFGLKGSNVTINGGNVTATGGGAQRFSSGVFSSSVTISGDSTVIATGGISNQNSLGVNSETVTISGGKVTANGGTATSGSSVGVYGKTVNVSGGEAFTTGGEAGRFSYGVFATDIVADTFTDNGSLTISGGTLEAKGNTSALNKVSLEGYPTSHTITVSANISGLPTQTVETLNSIDLQQHRYLRIQPYAAAISAVMVSGTINSGITPTNATITLTGGCFSGVNGNTDITSWFTNIPNGIAATLVNGIEANATTATVTFSGTPAIVCMTPITVTIPADVLQKPLPLVVNVNENAKWSISVPPTPPVPPVPPEPPAPPVPNGDYCFAQSPFTVYNASFASNATVWLTGNGLAAGDLLITERDPSGSAYQTLFKLANSNDVFATYNIYLRSGQKSTGSEMWLSFAIDPKYIGQDFTLVHQKADATNEYFYSKVDANGKLTFGPLYELSPFMLVKGTLAKPAAVTVVTDAEIPQTGDTSQFALRLGISLIAGAGLMAGIAICRKRNDG